MKTPITGFPNDTRAPFDAFREPYLPVRIIPTGSHQCCRKWWQASISRSMRLNPSMKPRFAFQ
ncbi:MAG: hypothetical protein DMF18_02975 [Verrucomicrobia bacterium]|nr:MAG: hypothetical protein DMF18_02975 [Verrucomicrobiota bacterium]